MSNLLASVTGLDAADGPCALVRLAGEADLTTEVLPAALDAEIAKKPHRLLVELSGLTFIDSSAIRVLIQAHRRRQAQGLAFGLVSPSHVVARVLRLIGADQVIPVYRSIEEALAGADPRSP